MTRLPYALVPSAALFVGLLPAAEAHVIAIEEPSPVLVRPWTPPPAPHVVVRPWIPPTTVVVRPWTAPPPVVVVRPWTPPPPPPAPTTVVVRPVVVTRSAPSAIVVAEAPEPTPAEVEVEDVEGGTIDSRGPGVRAARRVVVGGGFGGLMLAGGGGPSTLSSAFSVHLGVALRQASVGLRLDMAPDAVELADGTGGRSSAAYSIGGLGFGYHFNADSLFHPVVGASLELHALDPEDDAARFGFGIGARAGLEMEYPLDSGSLGIGLDVSGHRRFGSETAMPVPAMALAFGGTVDYRF